MVEKASIELNNKFADYRDEATPSDVYIEFVERFGNICLWWWYASGIYTPMNYVRLPIYPPIYPKLLWM